MYATFESWSLLAEKETSDQIKKRKMCVNILDATLLAFCFLPFVMMLIK